MPASIPQGSPLSPIFYIYYNADLLSGETSPQISSTTRATMVKPSAQTLTDRSPLTSISIGTPYHHSLAERTLHLYPKTPIFSACNSNLDRKYRWKLNNRRNLTVPSAYSPSRHLSTIFPRSLGPCTWFLPLQIQNSAPECQFSASLFSIKTRSNRVIKTPLSDGWYALKHTRTSDQSL